MKFSTTIVLLILLIAVGAWFVFFESGQETQYERDRRTAGGDKATGSLVFAEGSEFADAVTGFTIKMDSGTTVFAKEGDDWWQTEPIRFPLTSWNASNIPTDMGKLRWVRRFTPGEGDKPSLEKIQLAPTPLATVTLETSGGSAQRRHTVKLGRKTIGGIAYAMVDDDPDVLVINDALHDRLLDKALSSWRDKSIKGPGEGQVDQVVIEHGDTTITLAKADGNWALGNPHGGRADRSAIETLLKDIDGFYIKDFVIDQPDDLSTYGLDAPGHTIRIRKPAPPAPPATDTPDVTDTTEKLEDADPTIYTLRIGGPTDLTSEAFFATWATDGSGGDVVFTLGKTATEKLEKDVDDFRDPQVTPITANDVRQLRLERTDHQAVHLLQEDSHWEFQAPTAPGFDADHDAVQDLVDGVTTATASSYVADAAPADSAMATVTVGALARSEPDVLRLYATNGEDELLVLRNNETTGYLVPRDDLKEVFQPVRTWRNRQILDLHPDRINHVSVERPDGTRFEFSREVTVSDDTENTDIDSAEASSEATVSDDTENTDIDSAEASSEATVSDDTENTDIDSVEASSEATVSDDTENTDIDSVEESSASQSSDGTTPRPASPEPGPWVMAGGEAFESSSLESLVTAVANLRAEVWLGDDAGPTEAAIRIQIQTLGDVSVQIAVEPETRAAAVENLGMPFAVSESTAEKLDAELRDRTVLPITTIDMTSVKVVRGKQTYVLTRDGDDDYVDAGGATVDQSAVGGLFDTVAGLRVQRYVTADPLQTPALTIRITLADAMHTILISDTDDYQKPVHIGDRAALLSQEVFEKLVADLGGTAETD